MKNNVKYIIAAGLVLIFGGVSIFIFMQLKNSSSKPKPITTTTKKQDIYIEPDVDSNKCEEGIICLTGESAVKAPKIILGKNEVYAKSTTEETDPTKPLNVIVTNKDYKIWTVFWVTKVETFGYIKFSSSKENVSKIAYDDRDKSVEKKRFTHHVTVTNSNDDLLKPNLNLYFSIFSDEKEYKLDGDYYSFSNPPLASSPSTPNSITVTASSIVQGKEDDYIVIMRLENGEISSEVSNFFTSKGGCDLTYGIARKEKLTDYYNTTSNTKIKIRLYGPDGFTSYAGNVLLKDLEGKILKLKVVNTGYLGNIFGSLSGDYEIVPASGTSATTTTTTTTKTTTTTTITTTTPTSSTTQTTVNPLPSTSKENNERLIVILFGSAVLLLGLISGLIWVPLNIKSIWEKRVVSSIDDY